MGFLGLVLTNFWQKYVLTFKEVCFNLIKVCRLHLQIRAAVTYGNFGNGPTNFWQPMFQKGGGRLWPQHSLIPTKIFDSPVPLLICNFRSIALLLRKENSIIDNLFFYKLQIYLEWRFCFEFTNFVDFFFRFSSCVRIRCWNGFKFGNIKSFWHENFWNNVNDS